jgi:hypothetical protein
MVDWNSLMTRIILILFLALISYLAMRMAIWWAVKRSLVKTMHDRPQVYIEKRERALNRLFNDIRWAMNLSKTSSTRWLVSQNVITFLAQCTTNRGGLNNGLDSGN